LDGVDVCHGCWICRIAASGVILEWCLREYVWNGLPVLLALGRVNGLSKSIS
jgi:hypothetical protein